MDTSLCRIGKYELTLCKYTGGVRGGWKKKNWICNYGDFHGAWTPAAFSRPPHPETPQLLVRTPVFQYTSDPLEFDGLITEGRAALIPETDSRPRKKARRGRDATSRGSRSSTHFPCTFREPYWFSCIVVVRKLRHATTRRGTVRHGIPSPGCFLKRSSTQHISYWSIEPMAPFNEPVLIRNPKGAAAAAAAAATIKTHQPFLFRRKTAWNINVSEQQCAASCE